MASERNLSLSSERPLFQVIISVKTAPPISSGNHPP